MAGRTMNIIPTVATTDTTDTMDTTTSTASPSRSTFTTPSRVLVLGRVVQLLLFSIASSTCQPCRSCHRGGTNDFFPDSHVAGEGFLSQKRTSPSKWTCTNFLLNEESVVCLCCCVIVLCVWSRGLARILGAATILARYHPNLATVSLHLVDHFRVLVFH